MLSLALKLLKRDFDSDDCILIETSPILKIIKYYFRYILYQVIMMILMNLFKYYF